MIDLGATDRRFWDKVAIGPGCWNWQAGKSANGYGAVNIRGIEGDRRRLAHRVAWELVYGECPEQHVLHRCDNPACCRPSHLFIGTQVDNNADMRAKGRARTNGYEAKTHCGRGHEYTPENTARAKSGERACRACREENWRSYRARNRQSAEYRAKAVERVRRWRLARLANQAVKV